MKESVCPEAKKIRPNTDSPKLRVRLSEENHKREVVNHMRYPLIITPSSLDAAAHNTQWPTCLRKRSTRRHARFSKPHVSKTRKEWEVTEG